MFRRPDIPGPARSRAATFKEEKKVPLCRIPPHFNGLAARTIYLAELLNSYYRPDNHKDSDLAPVALALGQRGGVAPPLSREEGSNLPSWGYEPTPCRSRFEN